MNNGNIVGIYDSNLNGINRAIYFNDADLGKIGWLFFGDTTTSDEIKKDYNERVEYPICKKGRGINCNTFIPNKLPNVEDGQITIEGTRKVLHRFGRFGITKFGLKYHRLFIEQDGTLNIETQKIYEVDTGKVI